MMHRAFSSQGLPVGPNTPVTFSNYVVMDRSFTAHPMLSGSSETPYTPAVNDQFALGPNHHLIQPVDEFMSKHVDVQAYEPFEYVTRHQGVNTEDFVLPTLPTGVQTWMPMTPDLTDESSHDSSSMSRSASMVSTYMPGTIPAWTLNTEANDLLVPYKTQFNHIGTAFDSPITPEQEQFQLPAGYSFTPNMHSQDVTFSSFDMNRSMSSTTTSSAMPEPLSQEANFDHISALTSVPLTVKTMTDDEAQRGLCDESSMTSSSGTTPKMEIPRSKHVSSRMLESGHQGLMCNKCDRNPDGFRGDHELMRHARLFHARRTRKWVCADLAQEEGISRNREWAAPQLALAQCQNCKNGKQYGQYYNAAAHLRRYHFYPKPRGRPKGNTHPRRAGSAGGNNPAIAVLKKYWLRSVEVVNSPGGSDKYNDADEEEDAELRTVEHGAVDFLNAAQCAAEKDQVAIDRLGEYGSGNNVKLEEEDDGDDEDENGAEEEMAAGMAALAWRFEDVRDMHPTPYFHHTHRPLGT